MATIHVDIVSAEGEIFSGEASMVFAPAVMGDIGIAPRHAPLLTTLRPGEVRVQTPDGEEQFFYVSGGAIEIQPHLVTVLADTALRAKDIDEAAALQAKQRAEEALQGSRRQDRHRRGAGRAGPRHGADQGDREAAEAQAVGRALARQVVHRAHFVQGVHRPINIQVRNGVPLLRLLSRRFRVRKSRSVAGRTRARTAPGSGRARPRAHAC